MRCEHAGDDGAYVLGALSPAERAVFQRHLGECAPCRDAVAELAVVPGLLGRLEATTAEQVAHVVAAAEASRLPRLLSAARAERARTRRRQRWRVGLAAGLAACLVLVGAVTADLVGQLTPRLTSDVQMVAMAPVGEPFAPGHGHPLTAEVGFTETRAGTRISLHCSYLPTGEYHKAWAFRLYAVATDGISEQVASWSAAPGEELRTEGLTRFAESDLARVELRLGDGTPLLAYMLP